ncbi:DUF1963 domain-containing protein [Salinisphaera sp. Q1T1-3]|uniref:DUF1963 domain-containing protein n=1 Tax=Salinisphaera sp. Q1T1-3 TaxID=2321229 RepID=UPI000E71FFE2|nr:YwqG family protein [Salinisphaera sp. Q1T1-3]RJS91789.1 DUF1963 domain-containing protein [Salinisphaera sp. Q1T1-3]
MQDSDEPSADFEADAADTDQALRATLDALGLHTLADLKTRVQPLVRQATRLRVAAPKPPPEDAELKSHFGGLPYCEADEIWPQRSNGTPLHFVFQIFNRSDLEIPDSIRLIQFYYDLQGELSFDTDDDGWHVRIYKTLSVANQVKAAPPEALDTVPYCDIQFETIESLPDWEGLPLFDSAAADLSCVLDTNAPWESYQQIVQAQNNESDFTSQLGGYPQWIQSESTPEAENGQPMRLLFQIDSGHSAEVMWGDLGLVYVFYDETSDRMEFTLQSC